MEYTQKSNVGFHPTATKAPSTGIARQNTGVDMSKFASAMAQSFQSAQNSQSAVVINDQPFDMLPVPVAMSQTIASATGTGATAVTAYFGNEPYFNSTPTTNGSGAGSVTNTYGDGWSGKGYNQLFNAITRGVRCYGLTISFITTSTGAQNPSGLNTAATTLLVADLVGANQIPKGIVLNAGARNTQYLSGTMTVIYQFNINCLTQLSYSVPVGNTVSLTLLSTPQA